MWYYIAVAKDFEKYSKASKARWAKISPEETSQRMRVLVGHRWAKMTAEERKEYSVKLNEAKKWKKKK